MKKSHNITLVDIQNLYEKYHTPIHVQRHMKYVARLAVKIAKAIKKYSENKKTLNEKAVVKSKGISIDVTFIKNLALLHDLLKPLMFKSYEGMSKSDQLAWEKIRKKYPKGTDTDVASRILKKMGYTELARAIRSQVFEAPVSRARPLLSLAEKIVYYADKRIAHTKKVSLRERLDEGYRRYMGAVQMKKSSRILAIERKIFALEKELSRLAGNDVSNL